MCGIAGFIDFRRRTSPDDLRAWAQAMGDSVRHRGPDAEGFWFDAATGVTLAHRRLAILDLSPTGEQPMFSRTRRYVIVFNGEIYNFPQLRDELGSLGHTFRGRSDTEVMLAAFEHWGVAAAVPRLEGMFAFAVWDSQERCLILARDRAGEKPLYYGTCGGYFLFASELKALRAHPAFEPSLDHASLALYLRYGYVPGQRSIYQGISKLSPGTILQIADADPPAPSPYWSIREVADRGIGDPFRGSHAEAVEELDRLLRLAVRRQMVSDVPLGAFLSGGIDSSTIVGMMQSQSDRPVQTFTIGFENVNFDEAKYAHKVAAHLGTDHTELYLTAAEAMAIIPEIPSVYDEPFADNSQIPTLLVSRLARQSVTVALSGDAGDELFGGYRMYLTACELWSKIGWMRPAGRRSLAAVISCLDARALNLLSLVLGNLDRHGRSGELGDKLHKLADVMAANSREVMYENLLSHWRNPMHASGPLSLPVEEPPAWSHPPDFLHWMMYVDFVNYLPDDILVKVDRAAMRFSLETRIPLLDRAVINFAWRIGASLKVRANQGKWLLRQVASRYVPLHMLERPKTGFAIPVGDWLRGDLRPWAEDLLSEHRLAQEGLLDVAAVRTAWREHLSGVRNWQYRLWIVLMFQAWQSAWRAGVCSGVQC